MVKLVDHPVYGKGEVIQSRYGEFEYLVKFNDGIQRWVRKEEVRFLSENPILFRTQVSTPNAMPKAQFEARQMIEAFRLGIVPQGKVNEFTFGRENEINAITQWLRNPNATTLLLIGEYGSGKTHLLEYIYSLALQNNWAVSLIYLDTNELPFHKPKRIYNAIIRSFRYLKDKYPCDFYEFLREIAKRPDSYKIESHKYLGWATRWMKGGIDDKYILEWIEGHGGEKWYPQLRESSTCANIYCNILSGIGWAAKNILGLNGFLILFDESESVDPYWYSQYQAKRVWNFLTGLILMCNNDMRLLKEKVEINYQRQGYYGTLTDLQYSGHDLDVRYLWNTLCSVKCIFAFTDDSILFREPLNHIEKIKIELLSKDVLNEIFGKICLLYAKAYNKNEAIPKESFSSQNTRAFIKSVVEALDIEEVSQNINRGARRNE